MSDRLRLVKKDIVDNVNKIWNALLRRGKCFKCDGILIPDSSYGDVLKCIYCGDMYYKDYPKRTPDWEMCSLCYSYFKIDSHEKANICPSCSELAKEIKERSRLCKSKDIVINKEKIRKCALPSCGKTFVTHTSRLFCSVRCSKLAKQIYSTVYLRQSVIRYRIS